MVYVRKLSFLDWVATKVPLHYKTPKYIKVDVPIVAVVYRVSQLIAVALIFMQLYMNDGWALSEEPGGMSNAWGEAGTMLAATDDPNLDARTEYCSRSSLSRYSADGFSAPDCEAMLPAELVSKTVDSIFFTTSMLETVTRGWPCASANGSRTAANTNAAQCRAQNGTTFQQQNGQCGCETTRAVYALAVEHMTMSLEHAYDTSTAFGDWQGSSAQDVRAHSPELTLYPRIDRFRSIPTRDFSLLALQDMVSNLIFANGTTVTFAAGQALTLQLATWLKAANTSLEHLNAAVRADQSGIRPPLRTTGLNIRADIEYSNIDKATGRAIIGKRDVHADVTVRSEYGTWTGLGSEKPWVVYPTLPWRVPQDYHIVERQRQGVLFQFHVSGKVFKFDFFYLLNVVVAGLVMLKLANVITDALAFYGLPNGQSTILRNKRQEVVSKRSEFAEIGMKAALLAATYRSFDPDNNGTIEAVDIVRVFAHVEGVSWKEAHAIAHMIMADADTSDDGEVAGGPGGLSYIEYMTCVEGDAIDFNEFLKHVEAPQDATDGDECRKAFEEERSKLPAIQRLEERTPKIEPGPKLQLSEEQKEARLGKSGALKVRIKCASGLKAADKNGLSDPYLIVQWGKKSQKSQVSPKTLEPTWDEEFEFKTAAVLRKVIGVDLLLYVKDKDAGLGLLDEDLGKVSADLSPLVEHESIAFSECLDTQGRVEFEVWWADVDESASPSPKKKKKAKQGTAEKGSTLPSPAPLPAPSVSVAEVESTTAGQESPTKKKKKEKTRSAEAENVTETKQTV